MKVWALRWVVAAALLLGGWLYPHAAQANVEHDLQLWTPVTIDEPIRGKLRGYFEVNPRVAYNVSHIGQLLVRPGLEWRQNDDLGFFAGYLWQTNYSNTSGLVVHENRLWQQILADRDIKRFTVFSRSRLEQRFIDGVHGCSNRFRQMFKVNYNLNKRYYLTTSDELFVNLNSLEGGPPGGIDQNRIFAGVGVRTFKRSRVEIGYQLQYVNRRDQADDQANHAIVIQTFIGIRD